MEGVSSNLHVNIISSETILVAFVKHKDQVRKLPSTEDVSVVSISCKCFSKCLKNSLGGEQYQVKRAYYKIF